MASQSLYRKWRSQSFADLVGQEPVVQVLCHAVRDGRVAHAYLFCGPRGTGKTSAARLLAKAINCANPHEGEPCNQCLSCREISEGHSPDVIEIDAASNNSVDNIRELRGNVNVLSTGGRSKVYIVDEVHMLSTQAFNALLKTLEEPPPHVVFVLATTEAHKVLPTIVSRCQQLNFLRHTRRNIVARLQHIAQGEGLSLEPAAADLLARAAQGGMRDALSLLDQARAFCGTDIRLEAVRTMLGLADAGAVRRLIEQVAAGRSAEGLYLINELVEAGADLRQLNSQLAELWRALVLARAGADVARIMDCGPEEATELTELASHFTLDELTACARIFAANDTPARGLPVPQLGLELSYLECLAVRRRAQPVEQNVQPPAHEAGHSALPHAGRMALDRPAPSSAPEPPATQTPPAALPTPASAGTRSPAPRTSGMAPPVAELDLATLDGAPSAAPLLTQPGERAAAPVRSLMPDDGGTSLFGAGVDDAVAAESAAEPAPLGDQDGDWLRRTLDQWELIKKVCRQKRRTVAALLHSARPIMVAPGTPLEVVLQADYQFHLDKLREPSCRADIEWALEQVLERPCHVRLVLSGSAAPEGTGGSGGGRAPAEGDGPSAGGEPGAAGASKGTQGRHGAQALTAAEPAARAFSTTHNGHSTGSGNGGASAQGSGRGGTPAMRDGAQPYARRPPVGSALRTLHLDGPDAPVRAGHGDDAKQQALRAVALADPVIQEIMRSFSAELVEVYPLPPEHES